MAFNGEIKGMRILGQAPLDGKGDCMHVNVSNGIAYVGHMGENDIGTTILDVEDPTRPTVITQIPRPRDTHTHKVQVVGDIMLVNHERNKWQAEPAETWSAGVAVWSIVRPDQPEQVGFYPTEGFGVHRMTWWGGAHAYVATTAEGFTHRILEIVDVSEPTDPIEVGRWWFPGQNEAAGEVPSWDSATNPGPGDTGRQYSLHHAVPYGTDRLYAGYWDGGMMIIDIEQPADPKLKGHLEFGDESRNTHTAYRHEGSDIAVVTDEQLPRWVGVQRHVWLVDVREEGSPQLISRLPVPEGARHEDGINWGPHNLHEARPGSYSNPNIIFLTYWSGGLRVYDISDPTAPLEIAYFVPPAPEGQQAAILNDVYVSEEGIIFVTDRHAGGVHVLQMDLPSA